MGQHAPLLQRSRCRMVPGEGLQPSGTPKRVVSVSRRLSKAGGPRQCGDGPRHLSKTGRVCEINGEINYADHADNALAASVGVAAPAAFGCAVGWQPAPRANCIGLSA